MFIPKFLFSIDDRINKWLAECGKVDTVDETSFELVDFSTIMSDLKLNRYYCDLSENIRHVLKDTNTQHNQDKKRKSMDQGSPKIVRNKDSINLWKLQDDETWHMWRHKTGKGPTLLIGTKF